MIKIALVVNHILNLQKNLLKITQLRVLHDSRKKKGLGRGLSALFGDDSSQKKTQENQIKQ